MPGKKKSRSNMAKVKRLSFPDEGKHMSWLDLLLEAYHVIDRGVARAIDNAVAEGRRLACARGCSNCCATHKDIPVYPLELKGIAWYVLKTLSGTDKDKLREQLEDHENTGSCPFLINNACSIHQVRPMACRQFNVFGEPCAEGEDPFYTRREDVMDPVKKHVDQAFFIMLPFHGIEKNSERIKFIETGEVHRMVRDLRSCIWKDLVEKMKER